MLRENNELISGSSQCRAQCESTTHLNHNELCWRAVTEYSLTAIGIYTQGADHSQRKNECKKKMSGKKERKS